MMKTERQAITVMERLPNRRAMERVREAHHQLCKAADSVEEEKPIQEAQHEPVGGSLCKSVNPETRTGSDD